MGHPATTETTITKTTAGTSTTDGKHDVKTNEPKYVDIQNEGINIKVSYSKYKRQQKQKNKQAINIIFHYSKVKLSEAMEEVLNLGLNLAILPSKLDISQVLADFKRFERNMVWKEYFFKQDEDNEYTPPIFNSKKNLPENY